MWVERGTTRLPAPIVSPENPPRCVAGARWFLHSCQEREGSNLPKCLAPITHRSGELLLSVNSRQHPAKGVVKRLVRVLFVFPELLVIGLRNANCLCVVGHGYVASPHRYNTQKSQSLPKGTTPPFDVFRPLHGGGWRAWRYVYCVFPVQ